MMVSDTSCPDDPEESFCTKGSGLVCGGGNPNNVFLFNKLENFATMVYKGEHIVPRLTGSTSTTIGFTCGHVEPLGHAQRAFWMVMRRKKKQMGKQTLKERKMKQMMVKKKRRRIIYTRRRRR